MAKGGLFGGGGAGSMRPVPRPTTGPAPAAASPGWPAIFSRGQGGILPERGSQTQYDLVTSLVQAAMQTAPQSGSPLLAALAPMLGGAALSRVEGMRDLGRQREQDALSATLFGRPMSESERQLAEIMSNEDLPGFYRTEAERRLRGAMLGGPVGGVGGRSGGGGGGSRAGSPNPASAQPADADPMAVLLGATDGGALLTEPQRRQLFTMLRNPDATSQERQLAQTLLERHDRAIREGRENPTGLPSAPAAPMTTTPTAPSMPVAAADTAPAQPWWWPGTGGGNPEIPPPPPGTVPF